MLSADAKLQRLYNEKKVPAEEQHLTNNTSYAHTNLYELLFLHIYHSRKVIYVCDTVLAGVNFPDWTYAAILWLKP